MTNKKTSPLGSLVMSFHLQPLRWRHFFLLFLPYIMLVLGLVGYGYWRAVYGYTNYGPVAARTWGQPWFRAATLLTLPLLLYALRRIYRAHVWVKVHQQGLVIHRPPSRRTPLRWDEISGITSSTVKPSFLGWKPALRHRCLIHTHQGKSIRLHPKIKGLEDLIKILKKQVYPRLLPAYKKTYQARRPLDFGRLSISKDHLSYQDQDIPWSYIQGITAADGNLIIHLSPQQEIKVPTERIKNMELLVQIIQEEVRS